MNLSEKIKSLREAAGLTQAELADAVSVSEKVVSKWECGETKPAAEILPALADTFGTDIDALFDHTHNLTNDILTSVRDYIHDADPADVFDKVQSVLSHMILGAEIRWNEDSGCYTPEVAAEIAEEMQSLLDTEDPRPQIFSENNTNVETFVNIRNDRLKFAVLQQYPGDSFDKILDRYDTFRPIFAFLAMPGAENVLKKACSGELPKQVTADFAAEVTGAPIETVMAFLKMVSPNEDIAVIGGVEVPLYHWEWWALSTNFHAVIGAAYLISEKWGGHR